MSWSNVVFGVALAAAILSLLDWLLSRSAKARIGDAALHAWGWLTEQRSLAYVQKLRTRTALIILLVIGCVPIGWFVWGLSFSPEPNGGPAGDLRLPIVLGIFAVVLVVYLISFRWIARLFAWMLNGDAPWRWIVKAALLLLVLFAIVAGFTFAELPMANQLAANPNITGNFIVDVGVLIVLLGLSALILSLGFGLLLIVLVIVGSVLGVFAMIGVFKAAELIIARIVEYDKGPMTAAVVALTAVGTILKSIGS